MKAKNSILRIFLSSGIGYTLGALAGIVFIYLISKLGLSRWIISLINQNQIFQRLLGVLLIAGLFLALGGAITGGLGGWWLTRVLKTTHSSRMIAGSALAFAISSSVLILVFLLLISFIGLYNNFNTNRIEQFGIISGVFWLLFGLLTGILQALLSVRLRHSWRVILAAPIGFAVGGFILGVLVRFLNPTEGFKIHPLLTALILLLGMLSPFFLGGGALGIAYDRLVVRSRREADPAQYIFPARWQTILVAVTGLVIAVSLVRSLDRIDTFLKINASNLHAQLIPVTVGVQWTPAQPYTGNREDVSFPQADQDKVMVAGEGQSEYLAWCSSDGRIQYQQDNGALEQIEFPGCSSTPGLALDAKGLPHLVWYAQEILDTNGVKRSDHILVESIRASGGWSEAAIITRTDGPVTLSLTVEPQQNLVLVWDDSDHNLMSSVQENYHCDMADLSYLELAGLNAVLEKNLRPAGSSVPFCRNQYERIEYTPNPEPDFSDQPVTRDGAFDKLADLAINAQYEILFTTMQYEPNYAPPSPGSVLAEKIAELYRKVKANPSDYPRGMTVKILLGNYPELSTFTYGDQIYAAISDIRDAGIEKMVDPEIGWRLEVANFSGTYPHSHSKFMVVDGKRVVGVGYNFGYLHLPVNHPSGLGYDMQDLGLQISGPVAQDAISAFDDLWNGANQVYCEDFYPQNGGDWLDTCQHISAVVQHVPEVLRTYLPPEGKDHAFSIYRTKDYKEADTFVAASLASAKETIDMMHVNFSLEMICMANIIFPGACSIDNSLPWMDSVIEAVENNPVKVRVITETANSNGLENRVAVNVLFTELERLGLQDRVEIRFYNGKLHAKSALLDDQLLIIGSMNMHYSSWGTLGLTEYDLATNAQKAIIEYKDFFENKWAEAIPFADAEFSISP